MLTSRRFKGPSATDALCSRACRPRSWTNSSLTTPSLSVTVCVRSDYVFQALTEDCAQLSISGACRQLRVIYTEDVFQALFRTRRGACYCATISSSSASRPLSARADQCFQPRSLC